MTTTITNATPASVTVTLTNWEVFTLARLAKDIPQFTQGRVSENIAGNVATEDLQNKLATACEAVLQAQERAHPNSEPRVR